MSMGGGGGGSTTTVQKADPWSGLQPGLNTLYGNAVQNFNNGGPQYYPGQTTAGTNWDIENALNMGTSRAMQGPYDMTDPAKASLTQTINGRSPWDDPGSGIQGSFARGDVVGSNPAQGTLSNFANGAYGGNYQGQDTQNYYASGYGNSPLQGEWTQGAFGHGDVMGGNTANPGLNFGANGGYLDKQNPYLEGLYSAATTPMVQQFQNAIAPGLASQFSLAGRTGSGAHQGAFSQASEGLGRNLGATAASIYGSAYENERGRQQANLGTLSSNYNTERAQQLAAAQGLSGLDFQKRQQQLGAAQGLSGLQLQKFAQMLQGTQALGSMNAAERAQQLGASGMLSDRYGAERQLQQGAAMGAPGFQSGVQGMDFDRISKLLGVGQFRQGQSQDLINADKARYDYTQQLPGMNLQQLNQILQGGMSLNGSSTTGKENTQRNPFASGLGGAATGASIGSIFPGIGTGIGAIAGGLGGLLFG